MFLGTFKVSELFSVKVPVAPVAFSQTETLTALMNPKCEFTIGSKALSGSELTLRLQSYFTEHSAQTSVLFKADARAKVEQLLRAMEFFNLSGATSLRLLNNEGP